MSFARPVQTMLFACALAALLLVLPASAAPAEPAATAAQATCASASAEPYSARYTIVRSAILCLINAERRKRRLRPLRYNRRLATAASRHAGDMVRKRYFSHDSRDGHDFVDRIVGARYVRSRRQAWVLGENLAWGSGALSSPRRIVRAWMRSPGHRRNILNRRYRDIGVAFRRGAPVRGAERAATFVTEFGAR